MISRLLLCALVLGVFPAASPAADRPNFLVILCDDLGYGDLACYGHPHIQTPNLDRLAAEGMRLTSCYSAAPVCSPSRVGLMTGRSPNRAGVFDWIPHANQVRLSGKDSRHRVHLRRQEVTLPRLLQQAGYATALSGKWHCNAAFNSPRQPQPNDAGFDHWFATQNNAGPSHENPVNYVRNGREVGPLEGFSCQLAAGEAIQWLERLQAKNSDQPFFLYVAFHEPHEPVASPPELVAKYQGKARNEFEAQYFANVENVDIAVGRLLAALDRLGVAKDTLVYFSSDNGPETLERYPNGKRCYGSPGPLRGMKLWTTEGGTRVAGICRWPGKIQPGQVRDEPVSSLDLLPTFTKLAGAAPPADLKLDGTDVSGFLLGKGGIQRPQPLFWVYFNALNEQRVVMRDGDWKVLARLDGGALPLMENITQATAPKVRAARLTDFELYRLTEDIGESRDLSAKEPEKLAELRARLESLYRDLVNTMHVWPAGKGSGP